MKRARGIVGSERYEVKKKEHQPSRICIGGQIRIVYVKLHSSYIYNSLHARKAVAISLNSRTLSNDLLLRRLLARIIDMGVGVGILLVARQLLEGLALRLRDAQGREDTEEHEQCVNLHDVTLVWVGDCLGGCAFGAQLRDTGLADDGADFAHAGGETVGGGAVACGEAFAGDDEGGCVGA